MDEERQWGYFWATQDVNVLERPILVSLIVVSPSAGTACAVSFHNGTEATAPRIATIRALANQSIPIPFPKPLYLERGLFIDIDANTTGVLVVYKPLP